jgi:hypothetical protein
VFKYLPDDPATHVSRKFLHNIINTLDPSYFAKAIDEIENLRGRGNEEAPDVVYIDKAMFFMLTRMTALNITGKAGSKRSLAGLKLGPRKKTRARMNREYEISTAMDGGQIEARA